MKELVIISGKGGTGKTSLTSAFASLATGHVLCDADVDAADLHLLLHPEVQKTSDFMGGSIAFIRQQDCIECGTCRDLCKFDSISEDFVVDAVACEGCGVCVDLCPEQAIDFPVQKCGEWFISETQYGPMVHARLGIAEENSGKLVSLIRQQAKALAEEQNKELLLTDGPPGIGCPVIASITGATAILVVVEPSVSGVHDLKRVVELSSHFRIPAMVCINKYDLNSGTTDQIKKYIQEKGLELAGTIPFDSTFTSAMVEGKNIFEFGKNQELQDTVRKIWDTIMGSDSMNSEKADRILPIYKN